MVARANFPHVRVHTKIGTHPKFAELGCAELGLWLLVLTTSADHEKDGFAARGVVEMHRRRGGRPDVSKLVACGAWEEVEGGYLIHDFPQWQEVRSDKDQRREADRDRQNRCRNTDRDSRGKFTTVTRDHDVTSRVTVPPVTDVSPVSDPDPDPDPERDQKPPPLRGVPPSAGPVVEKPKRAKPGSACPASAASREELLLWCSVHGFPDPEKDREFAKFLDHHRAKRTVFADWPAAWRNWRRRTEEFAARGAPPKLQPGGGDWLERDIAARGQETGT